MEKLLRSHKFCNSGEDDFESIKQLKVRSHMLHIVGN